MRVSCDSHDVTPSPSLWEGGLTFKLGLLQSIHEGDTPIPSWVKFFTLIYSRNKQNGQPGYAYTHQRGNGHDSLG